jgi:CDP-glucose 4,6-dehydratase
MQRFFAGKTVLVTGHTGFKGSWLCHWLKRLGARVVGYSLPPHPMPALFNLAKVSEGMTSIEGDVRDLAHLSSVFAEHRPDVVLHLAAQALVRRAYREPVDTFSSNVMGTVNVLEACRVHPGTRAVVVVTSDKCYENREWVWGYREDEAMGGHDPYSASKACAELVTAAYRRSFFGSGKGPAVASARAGNVIGGGDFAEDRLVPDIIRGVAAGEKIIIRNPRSTRPWQHVLDPLSGYMLLARKLWEAPEAHAEAWNFGPGDEVPLPAGELAQRLVTVLGKGTLEIAAVSATAPHEAVALKLDCSKAWARLGWRARLGIDEALDFTARFYRAWLDDPASASAMLDRQIDDFQSRRG